MRGLALTSHADCPVAILLKPFLAISLPRSVQSIFFSWWDGIRLFEGCGASLDILFALNARRCQDTIDEICEVYDMAHPRAMGSHGGPSTFVDTLLCIVAGPKGSVQQRSFSYKAWMSGRGL